MKNKLVALSALIIGSLTLMTSYIAVEATTGSISVKVTLDGAPEPGVYVGISATADDREKAVYILEVETDDKGIVVFTAIAPGTYYLDAGFTSEDDDIFYAEADVTVTEGNLDITMVLEEY